jgi:ArsR family transcriptional regulator
MKEKTAGHIADVLRAIAHPVRLKIVEFLTGGEKSVGEIIEAVGGKQSITSQQLNMMKSRGILSCRKDGAKVFYRIENQGVIKLLDCMLENCEQ